MNYYPALLKSPLAKGLEDDPEYVSDFYSAKQADYRKGEFLNQMFEPLKAFGLVVSGTVQVCRDDYNGNKMIMANVTQGGIFGESLCLLKTVTSVYILAVTDCTILWLNTDRIENIDSSSDPRDYILLNNFSCLLAALSLKLNDRIQILVKPSLRSKIITMLSFYSGGRKEFSIPFDRESMAAYLGVNRASLSRELAKMRKEGLIDYSKNHFLINVVAKQ